MKLYFVRHGESQANVLQIFSNRINSPYKLTPRGIEQTKQIAETLQGIPFTHIYASPLLRTKETAFLLSEQLNLRSEFSDALREYDVGIFEDLKKKEEIIMAQKLYDKNEQAWLLRKQWDTKIEGGESFHDIRKRFIPFIHSLTKKHKKKDIILLVGHGGLFTCMLPLILTNITFAFSYKNSLDHVDYVEAELREEGFFSVKWKGKKVSI